MKPTDIVTINTTFKITAEKLIDFEFQFREIVNVIDFKHISNTEELYKTDPKFKKLVKAKKEATKLCELYINRYN